MKTWPILCLIVLTACSGPRTGVVKVTPAPPPQPSPGAVRNPELVRAYQVGRVIDPGNPGLLHEHHTVFRVEAGPSWDMHPGTSSSVLSVLTLKDSAFVPPPSNDELVAEINRQKEITKSFSDQAQKLGSALEPLMQALWQSRAVAAQNVQLRQELSAALLRLTALEAQAGVPGTNPATPAATGSAPPQP